MRLANKIAIVTGAAQGQGEAVARRFAQEGARLVLADLKADNVQRVAADIRQQGGQAVAIATDVSVAEQVAAMVETARREFGALHILYNNAGIYLKGDGPAAELPETIFDQTIDVNLKGVYLCCRYAIPLLLESGKGVILNVGSAATHSGDPLAHAYAAAKGGIWAFTRSIACYYGPQGLRALVICPGFIDTDMVADYMNNPALRDQVIQSTMLRRVGKAEEIANLATFLASDEAAFMTGAMLDVSGGLIK